jgi:HEAT repeat protein
MKGCSRLAVAALTAAVPLAGLVSCSAQPKAPDPVALVEKLKSGDADVRGAASLDLIRLGAPAVPALVELLRHPDPQYRALAARTFWGMGPKAGAAASALAEALSDSETAVRVSAVMALENMGPAAAPAVDALVKALRDPSAEVRPWAAKALGSVGPAAESAVPALTKAAKQEGVHGAAEDAIRKIRKR